jgi:guanylate kinase
VKIEHMSVLVVAGPSGVGKSSLIREALQQHNDWTFSVSATTRPRREHEQDGKDYFFLSQEEFNAKIIAGEFVEFANVYGNLYGTLKDEFRRARKAGKGLLIEVDSVGCLSIKALEPWIPIVAIVPPRYSVLRERLAGRGSESEQELEIRLGNAWIELARMRAFDFVIVNDDLKQASERFSNLLRVIAAGATDTAETIDGILDGAGVMNETR